MYNNREIIAQMRERLSIPMARAARKILWFTDTISDLNGVAETLKDIARLSEKTGQTVRIVAAMPENNPASDLPSNILFVPTFHSLRLPMYENLSIHFPSLLRSIEAIYKEEPTEIFISTPGPVGLLGLLASRLLKLKSTGIYHTDFTRQLERIVTDSSLPDLVERAMKWFYSMTDVIKVPTEEYIQLLTDRGYEPWKLQMIPKGIDPEVFLPDKTGARKMLEQWGIAGGITLLYAGRISKDKNLDLLCDLYRELSKTRHDINLVVVGDGPYLDELRTLIPESPRVIFTGRINREMLPAVYTAAHMFMFPSTTDTFGMVVLEAQACGLPAIVSDVGGPQEIISDGRTGFVAPHGNLPAWMDRTLAMIGLIENDPMAYARMKRRSRLHAVARHGRESFLDQVTGAPGSSVRPLRSRSSRRSKVHDTETGSSPHAVPFRVSLG
jgi:glycosyltransferase involved in cell wall biosynthesis